jgi:Family of unknown function (DUF6221)
MMPRKPGENFGHGLVLSVPADVDLGSLSTLRRRTPQARELVLFSFVAAQVARVVVDGLGRGRHEASLPVVTIVEFIAARLEEREALAQAAATTSEWDDGWSDLPVDVYEHAQAHDPAWALADIAAKRAMLDAHRIQHRCISATLEGEYELADDEPCLVVRHSPRPRARRRLTAPGDSPRAVTVAVHKTPYNLHMQGAEYAAAQEFRIHPL